MTTCKPLLTHQGFKLIDFIPADIEKFDNTIATRNHSEKTGRNNPMLIVIKSIALLFLLFCGVNVVWAEGAIDKSPYDDITDPTPDNLPAYSGTCEDLYPVTDFNNLLTQIYRHLDDDCLYLMSPDELSKKLGIEVDSNYDRETGQYKESRFYELLEKPFTGFNSAVFLEKIISLRGKPKKLTLKEQKKLRATEVPSETGAITYFVRLSHAYLENFPSPYRSSAPAQLPQASFSGFQYRTCTKDYKSQFNKKSWLAPSTGYVWNGYVGTMRFINQVCGRYTFSFAKLFF